MTDLTNGSGPSAFAGNMSRRSFIGRSATALLAVGGTSAFIRARAANATIEGSGQVVVLSWISYVTTEIISHFEKTTGIKMIGIAAADDPTMFTKVLAGGGSQYDLVFGNAGWSPTYHKHGLVEVLNLNTIQAAKNLYPIFRTDTKFPYVVAPNHTLLFPNMWAPLGMEFSLTSSFQPTKPYSWNALWQAPKGKVIMEGAGIDFLAIAGLANGVPRDKIYAMSGNTLDAATKKLIKLKPFQISQSVDQQVRDAIRTGRADIGLSSGIGDGALTNIEAGNKTVAKEVIPKEGTLGWVDGPHLVKGAKNRANALKFIEWWGSDPWLLDYLFTANNFAQCSKLSVNRIVRAGGKNAQLMKILGGTQPQLAQQMAFQRQPDNPDAWNTAYDQVQAA